nr:hypothetical protein [Spirochaetaceae bacterium]
MNLDLSLFDKKYFAYRDVNEDAPNLQGVYFWYLMPTIPLYIKDLESFFELIDDVPQKIFQYNFKSVRGLYFRGTMNHYKAD